MQILDEGGAVLKQYMWDDGTFAEGWIDPDTYALAEDSIAPGQSILIDSSMGDVKVTFVGQVGTGSIKIDSISGFNFVGNASPVDIDIQAITLGGDSVLALVDSIQILDDGGAVEKQFMWDDGTFAEGWIDPDTYTAAEFTLEAGKGVLIDTSMEGVEITLPCAL